MKIKSSLILLSVIILYSTVVYAQSVVKIAPLTYSTKSSSVTVGTTATALPATALAGRESIAIFNNGSNTIFIGGSDVTTSNGFPLTTSVPVIVIDVDDSVIVYGIVASGSEDARLLEAK